MIGKAAEWKVVQWSKGEWHLIGVNSPIGRGDVHLDHVSAVFNNLKQIAAMDKLWEVNVGLRKAVGCFSLHHLQVRDSFFVQSCSPRQLKQVLVRMSVTKT